MAIQAAHMLDDSFDGANSLYRDPVSKECELCLSSRGYDSLTFARIVNTLSEFGTPSGNSNVAVSYFDEHYERIIDGIALQVLAKL